VGGEDVEPCIADEQCPSDGGGDLSARGAVEGGNRGAGERDPEPDIEAAAGQLPMAGAVAACRVRKGIAAQGTRRAAQTSNAGAVQAGTSELPGRRVSLKTTWRTSVGGVDSGKEWIPAMVQQGQTIELTRRSAGGERLWAYRYRTGGRGSKRVQRGGFVSEQDAREALERELERLRRERRIARRLTLAELVETYLAQHDVQPVTIEKLCYLLSKATAVFGDRRIGELTSAEIAVLRIALSPGYRFEATQALRQVLERAVAWGMIDFNPAKVGVDNPVRRRKEQHPFESWAELEAIARAIGPRYGPMIMFAAATGLRPAEWIALEKRDVDRKERVVYVRRSFTRRELKIPKTEASMRAVPLQTRALDALERIKDDVSSPLLFPGERGGYLDIHHFRPFQWRPAQKAAGINPVRRVYDLRHTFATFALRAGISTFDLSR
jgi:integrase